MVDPARVNEQPPGLKLIQVRGSQWNPPSKLTALFAQSIEWLQLFDE